jgi:hypothetical protein
MKVNLSVLVTSLVVFFALSVPAKGLSRKKHLEDLVSDANLIFIGTVLNKASFFDKDGSIQTEILLKNEVQLSPIDSFSEYVKVIVPGGEIGDVGMVVSDSPGFNLGETTLLFLAGDSGRYVTVGADQGKVTIIGKRLAERDEYAADLLEKVFSILEAQKETSFKLERNQAKALLLNLSLTTSSRDQAVAIQPLLSACTKPSGIKWSRTSVGFTIGSDIPFSWTSPISAGASAWNQAGSRFRFTADNQGNTISFRNLGSSGAIAVTTVSYSTSTKLITKVKTEFNSALSFSTSGAAGKYDVQNTMAHEFGHWLHLGDIYTSSCSSVTMYGSASPGTTYQRSLESADKEGIVAIYGR